MEIEPNFSTLTEFELDGIRQVVNFKSTSNVTAGVECDVYTVIEDPTKDLGIIRVNKGHSTPLQRVLQGDRTIEGYISGKGRLVVTRSGGIEEIHEFGTLLPNAQRFIDVGIGDVMQWQAAEDSGLVAYEICYPPYQDGRYENIE